MSLRVAVAAVALALLTGVAGAATATQGPSGPAPRPAPEDVAMPPMDNYQFGLLVRGAGWTPGHDAHTDSLQAGHMANIKRMWEVGKLVCAGPFLDDGALRGVFIFKADSLGEARALAAGDPAIASGRLALQLWDWSAPAGIGARARTEATRPGHRDSMVRVVFGFLDKGVAYTEAKRPGIERDQAAHVARILGALREGLLLSAGPLDDAGEHRGVLVFAPGLSEEAARVWCAGDPHVKSGRLKVVMHPWMFADGSFR